MPCKPCISPHGAIRQLQTCAAQQRCKMPLQGLDLLHTFLSGLQQVPRRKQPVDLHRPRQLLENYQGRVAAGVPADSRRLPHGGAAAASPLGRHVTSGTQQDDTAPQSGAGLLCRMRPGARASDAASAEDHADSGEAQPAEGLAHARSADSQQLQGRSDEAGSPEREDGGSTAGHAHFQVDHVFEVMQVGTVVSGTLVRGAITVNSVCWLGPNDDDGAFAAVKVTSIHRSQVPVRKVSEGQYATLAIEPHTPGLAGGAGRGSADGAGAPAAEAGSAVVDGKPSPAQGASAAAADAFQATPVHDAPDKHVSTQAGLDGPAATAASGQAAGSACTRAKPGQTLLPPPNKWHADTDAPQSGAFLAMQ